MQLHLHTDSNIHGSDDLRVAIQEELEKALSRFNTWITRVEVHLSDVNSSAKSGANDKRCAMEARPANHQPVKVSNDGASVEQAYKGAIKKLQRMLGDIHDRLHDVKGKISHAGDQTF